MILRTLNAVAGAARQVHQGGRRYLVAPVTLIVPGVLSGSRGPLYYPPQEVKRGVAAWNGYPLVVGHPQDHVGNHVSASEVPERHIGELRRNRWNGKKHVAEAWFDAEKTRKQSREIYDALLNGRTMEVSTGVYTDNEDRSGTDPRGRQYVAIARNYRPDHLAILPNEVGACSLHDGCGLNVNRGAMRKLTKKQRAFFEQEFGMDVSAVDSSGKLLLANCVKCEGEDCDEEGVQNSFVEDFEDCLDDCDDDEYCVDDCLDELADNANPDGCNQHTGPGCGGGSDGGSDSDAGESLGKNPVHGRNEVLYQSEDLAQAMKPAKIAKIISSLKEGDHVTVVSTSPNAKRGSLEGKVKGFGKVKGTDHRAAVIELDEGGQATFSPLYSARSVIVGNANPEGCNQYKSCDGGGSDSDKLFDSGRAVEAALESGKVSEDDFNSWNTGASKARDSNYGVGAKVAIDKNYGGGTGYVVGFDRDGSFAMVKTRGDIKSFHNSDLKLKPTTNKVSNQQGHCPKTGRWQGDPHTSAKRGMVNGLHDPPKPDDEEEETKTRNSRGTKKMKLTKKERTTIVGSLVGNCSCKDRKALNSLSDEALLRLKANMDAPEEEEEMEEEEMETNAKTTETNADSIGSGSDQAGGEEDEDSDAGKGLQGNAAPPVEEEEEEEEEGEKKFPFKRNQKQEPITSRLTPEELEVWNSAKEIADSEKKRLATFLTQNVKGKPEREVRFNRLMQKPVSELREMAELFPTQNQTRPQPHYIGAGGGPVDSQRTSNAADPDLLLDEPTLNFQEISEGNRSHGAVSA